MPLTPQATLAADKLRRTYPSSERLYVPFDAESEAVIEITIKSNGLGAVDPPTRRAPSARELHLIADLLTRRVYQFHPSGD